MAPLPITWFYRGNTGLYTGELDSDTGKPSGTGTILYASGPLKGFRYEGNWFAGFKQGPGKLTGPEYEYEGSFRGDQPEGHGVKKYKSGNIYDGWWKAGLKEGGGTMTWPRMDWVYSGEWQNGKISGKGTWHSETRGVTYYGDNWKDDQVNGTGTARYSRGDIYKGRFVKGMKEDTNAFYTYPNGKDTYTGGFKDNLRDGTGTLVMGDYKYQGSFSKGKKTGRFVVTDLRTGKITNRTY
jgi:hypothetical protein